MGKLRLGPNFAVFALFFGVAALEAFDALDGVKIVFWLAIAFVFLYADVKRDERIGLGRG